MRIEIARQLRDHLAKHPVGFPVSKDELELEMINRLFTEDEAKLAINLTHREETADEIAGRVGQPRSEVAKLLESMAHKGAIYKNINRFSLAGYAVGMYEFQINDLDEDTAKLYDALGNINYTNLFGSHTPPFRTLPVEKTLPVNIEIAPFERASEILKQASCIALTDCECRKKKGLLKKGCSHPKDEMCIILNGYANFYIENNIGRKVTVDEALKAIQRGEDAGLVRQVTNVRNDYQVMCQCCICCCGILRTFAIMEQPNATVKSNYMPVIDLELCVQCEECAKACPTGALKMENDQPVHNEAKCIGCGVCVNACASGAITLHRKPSTQYIVPPADVEELYTATAYESGRTAWYK